MYSHNGTLYPMLGVGAFMTMFWTGIVIGDALGLGCVALPVLGLLSGCIATLGVCELQRRDGHGPASAGRAGQGVHPAGRPLAPAAGRAGRPTAVPAAILGARLSTGPGRGS
jgi:hypothetical protein